VSTELPDVVDPDHLRELVVSRPWWHRIDLGHGIVTPGLDDSARKLEWLQLPDSLDGKSVLDVGAYDGFFSFEAERRGARRVVASDWFAWKLSGMGDGRGFDIAHWALGSQVEKREIKVEDISRETVGTFDVVLFLGVLYHSPDPLGYLRRVFEVCDELTVIETHVDGLEYDRPMMVFYPGDSLGGDPSNFWGPNEACVIAMCEEAGFSRVERKWAGGARMVFHAWR
jgi:tRNA (mo5U34)-methyltransferase